MSNMKISDYTQVIDLGGNEFLLISQDGVYKKVTLDQIRNLATDITNTELADLVGKVASATDVKNILAKINTQLSDKANQSGLDTTNANVTANTNKLANTIIAYSAGTSKGISNANATVVVSASASNVEIARVTTNQYGISCIVHITMRYAGGTNPYTVIYLVSSRGGTAPVITKVSEAGTVTGLTFSFNTVARLANDYDIVAYVTNGNATGANFITNFIVSKGSI